MERERAGGGSNKSGKNFRLAALQARKAVEQTPYIVGEKRFGENEPN